MLRYLLRYLQENKIYALIILDEIDYLIKITKDSGIIYDLSRLNEFDPENNCNVKGVIFIARSTEFYSRLDQAELSYLGRVPLEFPKYNINQVSEILSSRCQDAFRYKNHQDQMSSTKSPRLTISPTVNGDVRYSLDLLLYAGNLAESQGTERITLDQIRKVNSQINPSITSEEIEELSSNQIFTLMAVIRALRVKKKQ